MINSNRYTKIELIAHCHSHTIMTLIEVATHTDTVLNARGMGIGQVDVMHISLECRESLRLCKNKTGITLEVLMHNHHYGNFYQPIAAYVLRDDVQKVYIIRNFFEEIEPNSTYKPDLGKNFSGLLGINVAPVRILDINFSLLSIMAAFSIPILSRVSEGIEGNFSYLGVDMELSNVGDSQYNVYLGERRNNVPKLLATFNPSRLLAGPSASLSESYDNLRDSGLLSVFKLCK